MQRHRPLHTDALFNKPRKPGKGKRLASVLTQRNLAKKDAAFQKRMKYTDQQLKDLDVHFRRGPSWPDW